MLKVSIGGHARKGRAVNQGQVEKMVFENYMMRVDALYTAVEIMVMADGTHSTKV